MDAGRVLSDLSTVMILGALAWYALRVIRGERHTEPAWRFLMIYLVAGVLGLAGKLLQHQYGFWTWFYLVIVTAWVGLGIWHLVDWWRDHRETHGLANVEEYDVPDA